MVTEDINNSSLITGKLKKYLPNYIAYVDTIINEDLENVILVYCYFGVVCYAKTKSE